MQINHPQQLNIMPLTRKLHLKEAKPCLHKRRFFKIVKFSMIMILTNLPLATQAEQGEARSIPRSEDKIIGKLFTPDGGEFKFMVKDGGMLRVTHEATGDTAGFVFVFNEESDAALDPVARVHEFEITKHPSGGGDAVKSLERPIELFHSGLQASARGLQFEIEKVARSPEARAGVMDLFSDPLIYETNGTCCISCGGYTVCGCAVQACGSSCCAGSCCGGGGGPEGISVQGQ